MLTAVIPKGLTSAWWVIISDMKEIKSRWEREERRWSRKTKGEESAEMSKKDPRENNISIWLGKLARLVKSESQSNVKVHRCEGAASTQIQGFTTFESCVKNRHSGRNLQGFLSFRSLFGLLLFSILDGTGHSREALCLKGVTNSSL